MTYKDKLIDLLKSDDETRDAIEKLEFGCKIKIQKYIYNPNWVREIIVTLIDRVTNTYRWEKWFFCKEWEYLFNQLKEIIWLPLSERFIRMYCRNKWLLTMYKSELQFNYTNISVELDDTRDFDNQDDTIYQKIYEALYNLTK